MPDIPFEDRPWGKFEILIQADGYKVKQVTVLPEKRLSLQLHKHRSEHWVVAAGTGLVICADEEVILQPGDSINIPVNTYHRIGNIGKEPLIFIELQRGDYLGEDDILRIEDDFKRI